jgi:hypothetical protein
MASLGADPEQLERFEDAVLDFLFARNAKLAKLDRKIPAGERFRSGQPSHRVHHGGRSSW